MVEVAVYSEGFDAVGRLYYVRTQRSINTFYIKHFFSNQSDK